MSAPVLAPHRATFRAFAETAVPEMASLDAAGWVEVEGTIEGALAGRPPRMRRQLALLLRVLDLLPLPRYGRRFRGLAAEDRMALLNVLQHSSSKLLRRGVWGLRTLVLMGYYTRPRTMVEVGYRAHPRGWQARSEVS